MRTSSSPRRLRRLGALVAAAGMVTASLALVGVAAPATAADAPVVLSAGNIALTPKLVNSASTLDIDSVTPGLVDKTSGYATERWYSATDAVLHLGEGEHSDGVWSTPQSVEDAAAYTTGDDARLLLSTDNGTETDYDDDGTVLGGGVNPGAWVRSSPQKTYPAATLVSVSGPEGGRLRVNSPETGEVAWDSEADTQTPIFLPDWDDYYSGWSFTQAGRYCVTVSMTERSYKSKEDLTAQATYTVYVGDLPENPTTCDQVAPVDDGGDGEDPITVLSKGHMDVRPWLNSAGDGIVVGGNQDKNVPSKDLVMTGTYEMSVPEPTADLDWTFIGEPGTRIWEFDQAQASGYLWPGFASGFNDGELKKGSQVSLTLEGVSGPGDGDVWLWTSSSLGAGNVQYSSVWGLPHTWSNATAFHSHNYWAFTKQGRYCLNFAATAQKPDGSYIHGSGQITIWAGDAAQASSVVPCDRDTTPAVDTLPALSLQDDRAGYLSAGDYDEIQPYLTSDSKLDVAVHSQKQATDPATDRDLDDVIVSVPTYITGQGYRTGYLGQGGTILRTDSDRVPWSAVDTPIDWELGDARGPGTVTMGQESAARLTTAGDSPSASFELPPQSNSNSQYWAFSEPGVYCVPFTMSVTPKGASAPVSASKTLTVVAGSTDPAADDYVDRSGLTTCANGQQPTAPSGDGSGDDNGGDDNGVSDADVFVPNESLTDSGAVILNDGHVDIASKVHGDTLETWVKDTTETSTPRYHPLSGSHSMDSDERDEETNNGNGTVFQVLPQAETTVPDSPAYSFLGDPGDPVWQVTQTQQTDLDLLWPGWSTEEIPLDATQTGVKWTLDKATGPGKFSLATTDADQIGKVDVLFNTGDGVDDADSFEIAKNSHVHGTWSFTAQGSYCLGFTRSTTLADGTAASDAFTLAVAVGRVAVKKVDPSACAGGSSDPEKLHTAKPTISGTAQVGKTLSAKPGSWTAGTSFGYQWLRAGKAIKGATKAAYQLVAADAGQKVSVRVTGSKSGYASAQETSAAVTVKAGVLTPGKPGIAGTARVGKKLTARPGTWSSGAKLAYQWLRNGKAIAKATKASYTLVAADAGTKLSVRVTGSKTGYATASKTSAAKKVAKGTLSGTKPKVKGKAKVGKTLRARPGHWSPGVRLHYQWFAGGRKIKGATHAKLKLTKKLAHKMGRKLVHKRVWVKVTATKAGYRALVKKSARTAKVRR